jgi:hypothetical protein
LHWYCMCILWNMLLLYYSGLKLLDQLPFEDLHICDVCNCTYYWQCLLKSNCFNANEREAIDTYDTWACTKCLT